VAVEILLIVFALVIVLSMAVQAFVFWRLSDSARKLIDRLERVSTELETESREVMDRARDVLSSFEHLRHISEAVESRAEEINQMVGQRVQDIDRLVGKLLDVGSRQADKVDSVVTDTVDKFEETTAVIQQDIVRPVVEISSLVKGLRTGLEYLFSKRQIRSDDAYPEDELFI